MLRFYHTTRGGVKLKERSLCHADLSDFKTEMFSSDFRERPDRCNKRWPAPVKMPEFEPDSEDDGPGAVRSLEELAALRDDPHRTSAYFHIFLPFPLLIVTLVQVLSTGVGLKVVPRFGELCSCCCLPLLPQFA